MIGCGFIGSNVAIQIARDEQPPTVLTRSRPGDNVVAAIGETNLLVGDAADAATVETALEGMDHVAYCAGGLLPAASERNPELDRQLTLRPLRTVLAALRNHPRASLTYLSSGGTVYGDPARLPARESDPTIPVSAYGSLHLACEREIEQARLEHGIRSLILRCSTVYGEHQRPDRGQGVVVTFLDHLAHDEPIELFGGGSTIRDYIYVGDVGDAITSLAKRRDAPPIVNVGSGRGTSLLEILRLAEKQVGRSAQIVQRSERKFDVHQIVLDTTRLHQFAKVKITTLETGIELTHRWLEENRRGADD